MSALAYFFDPFIRTIAARAAPLVRRCFTCDQPLRDDESDPCDRCNDADYYRAQEKDDR